MEKSTEVPQKTKKELPYNPAIPLLGTYLEKTLIQNGTCAPVFTAALTVYNGQDMGATQTPVRDERIKKMWYMHTKEYYSATKRMK